MTLFIVLFVFFFFFKQKTAYEMRISDWSSDVCSSDLHGQFNYRSARSLNGRICVRISVMKAKLPFLVAAGLAGVLALSGCYGYDDGYGYGGVSVGSGYYGSSYYDPYYGGNYGWYNGYYYPGAGYYVYDRGGKRHRWNKDHRRHWQGRRNGGTRH